MIVAGVDVAKLQLDLAFWPAGQRARHANDAPGRQALIDDLKARGIVRLGLEASGGYERLLVREARAAGIDVVVFQPAQVKAYAVFIRRKAKTDRLDAALIAECTARTGQPGRPQPPGYAVLAEIMTRLEQIEDDLMRAKTRRDAFTCKALKAQVEAEVARCKKARDKARAALIARVEADPDIKHRFDLILSVPGIGPRTALAFLLRMPEIGSLDRAEAAALAGLAPFDDQSGDSDGLRHIKGGRARLRKSIYMAALPAACRHNPQLVALYNRLVARGKRPKIALVACARKLTIFVNAVIARGTPWQTQHVNPNGCSQ
jgi:transposase